MWVLRKALTLFAWNSVWCILRTCCHNGECLRVWEVLYHIGARTLMFCCSNLWPLSNGMWHDVWKLAVLSQVNFVIVKIWESILVKEITWFSPPPLQGQPWEPLKTKERPSAAGAPRVSALVKKRYSSRWHASNLGTGSNPLLALLKLSYIVQCWLWKKADRREAVQLPYLWRGIWNRDQAAGSWKDPHRGKDIQMPDLPKSICTKGWLVSSRKSPHRGKAIQVPGLSKSVRPEEQLGLPQYSPHGWKPIQVPVLPKSVYAKVWIGSSQQGLYRGKVLRVWHLHESIWRCSQLEPSRKTS